VLSNADPGARIGARVLPNLTGSWRRAVGFYL
jgi:hypothetical protein